MTDYLRAEGEAEVGRGKQKQGGTRWSHGLQGRRSQEEVWRFAQLMVAARDDGSVDKGADSRNWRRMAGARVAWAKRRIRSANSVGDVFRAFL